MAARVAHAALYIGGVPWTRTTAWAIGGGGGGTAMVYAALLA